MSRRTRRERPGGNRGAGLEQLGKLHGRPEATLLHRGWQSPSLPRNWRDRLPSPAAYYGARVAELERLQGGDGWAQGRCPFHDDQQASLSVNLAGAKGGWRCLAGCGRGDMVAFHMRLTGIGFAQAVRDLMEVAS